MQTPSASITLRENESAASGVRDSDASPTLQLGGGSRKASGRNSIGAFVPPKVQQKVLKQVKILYLNIQIQCKIYANDTFKSFVRRVSDAFFDWHSRPPIDKTILNTAVPNLVRQKIITPLDCNLTNFFNHYSSSTSSRLTRTRR